MIIIEGATKRLSINPFNNIFSDNLISYKPIPDSLIEEVLNLEQQQQDTIVQKSGNIVVTFPPESTMKMKIIITIKRLDKLNLIMNQEE